MNEVKETVEHALAGLTTEERTFVTCRFGLDGQSNWSTGTIAMIHKTSDATVRRLLHSALDKMRAAMDREEVEG